MRRTSVSKSALIGGVVALALLAAGCGSSSDPVSWEDAETQLDEDGSFPVQRNFNESCREANTNEGGFDDTAARVYCRCAFQELRDSLTFDEFDALDDGLRTNPDPNALEGVAAAAWRIAEPLLEDCAADATA